MTTALQQQVFALDAKFNAHRAPNVPNFRTFYIRRRSQLLRESNKDPERWRQYLRLRSFLLQQRYGNSSIEGSSNSALGIVPKYMSRSNLYNDSQKSTAVTLDANVVPTQHAEASRALVGGNTIAENYAFRGVYHIFDQHSEAVTMVKFANNDRSRLCCSSVDKNLSICCVISSPPTITLLKGHTDVVTGFDWSANNDLIASSSKDTTIRVWNVFDATCLRILEDTNKSQLHCCIFQPVNNNLLITGNSRGEVRIANVSTGRFKKNVCRLGGHVLCLAFDTNGKLLWAGNNKGEIISVLCEIGGGLCRAKRLNLPTSCSITSLSYRAWISREARDPMLLVNSTDNSLCLCRVIDREGGLQLKRKFKNCHQKHLVRSTFCPIMSFRQGACVVTGSEDSCIYFLDIEKSINRACVNTLQGHASAVLGISFNYDESLLATSDLEGLVILWKRTDLT